MNPAVPPDGAGLLLQAGRLLTPDPVDGPGWVHVVAGLVSATAPGPPPPGVACVDLGGDAIIVPGLVDMHVHGGGGATMTTTDADELRTATAFHLRHGTTACLVSLVTAPWPELVAQLATAAAVAAAGAAAGVTGTGRVVGVHLEGPFLSAERRGVHPAYALRDPDPAALDTLLAVGAGQVRMVTLAPERPGALGRAGAVARLASAGVTVALGHTDASAETCIRAIAEGATVGTHLFNGMRPLGHRDPGPVGALLDAPGVTVELIADGRHVDPVVGRLALAAAGPGRVALITDAVAATGAPEGEYALGGARIRRRDGVITADDGVSLGGSDLTMAAALRFAVERLGLGLPDALRCATTVPAAAVGLAGRVGRLLPGRAADLVVLGRDLDVRAVMLAGRWVVPPSPRT